MGAAALEKLDELSNQIDHARAGVVLAELTPSHLSADAPDAVSDPQIFANRGFDLQPEL